MGADRNAPQNAHKETNSKSKIKGTDKSIKRRTRWCKRPRAELTMTRRLFLLRDDHLFVRILGYCWFVDTDRKMVRGDYLSQRQRNLALREAAAQE